MADLVIRPDPSVEAFELGTEPSEPSRWPRVALVAGLGVLALIMVIVGFSRPDRPDPPTFGILATGVLAEGNAWELVAVEPDRADQCARAEVLIDGIRVVFTDACLGSVGTAKVERGRWVGSDVALVVAPAGIDGLAVFEGVEQPGSVARHSEDVVLGVAFPQRDDATIVIRAGAEVIERIPLGYGAAVVARAEPLSGTLADGSIWSLDVDRVESRAGRPLCMSFALSQGGQTTYTRQWCHELPRSPVVTSVTAPDFDVVFTVAAGDDPAAPADAEPVRLDDLDLLVSVVVSGPAAA